MLEAPHRGVSLNTRGSRSWSRSPASSREDLAAPADSDSGAKLFGVTQPRISDLNREKIDRFTLDALVNMLAHAG